MLALYLASASPRRRELLAQIGIPFRRVHGGTDETPLPREAPDLYVERLARAKAEAGWVALESRDEAAVLGADTAVVLDGRILGKPLDRADGLAMLEALSGRTHEVLTAIALVSSGRVESRVVRSQVTMRSLSAAEREAYWDTGEPLDKAGAYGIQGLAAVFIERLEGSYTAVVGLPLCETAELLGAFGIPCWQSVSETP